MLSLSVCIGSSCHINGAYNIVHVFQQLIEINQLHDKIDFKSSFCMKECHNQCVSVLVNGKKYSVDAIMAEEFFVWTVMPMLKKTKT